MSKDTEQPISEPVCCFDPDDAITLLVGPGEQKMLVDGTQIIIDSELFAAALKKE